MRQKKSKELMEWNFDDQTAKYTYQGSWDNDQNSRPYGPCATSTTGKLFLYSGNLDSKTHWSKRPFVSSKSVHRFSHQK